VSRGGRRSTISDEQIADAYVRFGSVWAAGRELGLAGQTIHKRMKKAGLPVKPVQILTDEEARQIRVYYETTPADEFALAPLANRLGRTRSSIARYAGQMGLTKRRPHNAEVRKRQGAAISEKWKMEGHPRGSLGMIHSPESLAKMSAAAKRTWATSKAFGIIHMAPEARDARSLAASKRVRLIEPSRAYTRAAGGRREDIGQIWFRSSWEANYARYLNLLVKMKIVEQWDYEPQTFWFEGVKRGVVSYLPDFRVCYRNDPRPEYIEIKGWITQKDRTKWARMKKFHPDIKLVVVGPKEYREIANKWASALPNWERGRPVRASIVQIEEA